VRKEYDPYMAGRKKRGDKRGEEATARLLWRSRQKKSHGEDEKKKGDDMSPTEKKRRGMTRGEKKSRSQRKGRALSREK